MNRSRVAVVALSAIALTLSGVGMSNAGGYGKKAKSAAMNKVESGSIVTLAAEAGTFKTLLTAAKAAGLAETLDQEGPFTVFAPTDDAFAALPAGALQSLLEQPEQLKAVLLLHVIPSRTTAWDVARQKSLTNLGGSELAVSTTDGVSIAGAKVLKTDLMARNGVIHVIDRVILPNAN